jgi:alkylation response protein AidB-like acyl-CoA dehydrogenase
MSDLAGAGSGFLVEDKLNSLSYTIAAGTSQIQRNIVAERILGLPKER